MASRFLSHVRIGVAAALLAVAPLSAHAGSIVAHISSYGISWTTDIPHGGAELSITGPKNFSFTDHADTVADLKYEYFPADGLYTYQIVLEPLAKRVRGEGSDTSDPSASDNTASGTIRVKNGMLVNPDATE